jgi:hypothetical protein
MLYDTQSTIKSLITFYSYYFQKKFKRRRNFERHQAACITPFHPSAFEYNPEATWLGRYCCCLCKDYPVKEADDAHRVTLFRWGWLHLNLKHCLLFKLTFIFDDRFPVGDLWRSIWLEALKGTSAYAILKRQKTTTKEEDITRLCWLCSAHFEEDCVDKGQLKLFSIPTKFITDYVMF